ncbi:MAG: adenosylcobalamin-dependent ribonucleoside-diphosphate reductase [Nanoarchaeota archaeon]|nr:adenosylcobalamin-dependent ribonucleoside-diphosphate reductase [Nanoarchaeota archaeon]
MKELEKMVLDEKSEVLKNEFFRKMEAMFAHKSKLSTLVDPQKIRAYKETYFFLLEKFQAGELPLLENYFGDNVLAENIYRRKYYLKDLENETVEKRPEDVFMRLAAYIACVEERQEEREKFALAFYKDLFEGHYLPGGRVIAGSGDLYRLKTLANCFVSEIAEDSLEGIYKTAYEAARTYSFGGGIGIDISQLRPKNARVHNAADSSTGAVSFMELYSLTTGLIGQSGRRGALMLTIDIKHPDVLDFMKVKKEANWVTDQIMERLQSSGMFSEQHLEEVKKNVIENTQVRFANISIKVSDEFMSAVEEQNLYGPDKVLVYKKKELGGPVAGLSADTANYGEGMSKKELSKYELLEAFDNLAALNEYLLKNNIPALQEKDLQESKKRDYYGDYVIQSDSLLFDLAIRYSGDFLTYYSSSSVGEIKQLHKARDFWNTFVEGNYKTAEPGLLFWSQMSKYSPSNYVGTPIISTNPCGEVPLEDGGACNLGSINLSRMVKHGYTSQACVDWSLLRRTTAHLIRFLDNVVWWNESLNALEKQRGAAHNTRRLGLGVMGIADMFNQLGFAYDSAQALELLEKVMNEICQTSYKTSALLAKEKGSAPCFEWEEYKRNPFFKEILDEEVKELVKEHGLRNIALLSIAPTGTISNAICGFRTQEKNYMGISGGIEPVFALFYTRRSEQMNQGAVYNIFHNTVQAYLDLMGKTEEAKGANEEKLKGLLPSHFFRTAHHISPEMRVKVQAIAQKYIDHSISSTVNLSEDVDPETISDIYIRAWKNKLKGITVYRDGSRYPILSVESHKTEFQKFKDKQFKIKDGDEVRLVKGNDILVSAGGRLTTVYHGKSKGLF